MTTPAALRLLALLLAALALAGCASQPSQSTTPTPSATDSPSATPTQHAAPSSTGFAVDGPTITPVAPLVAGQAGVYEDDGVKVAYTVTQPASANGPATFFVTFLYNKTIVTTDPVTLAPGQSRSFAQTYPNVTGLKEITAEVRAGSTSVKGNATILKWPRMGSDVPLAGLHAKIASAGVDATDNSVVVNVTFARAAGEPLAASDLRARLLCADAEGNVTRSGNAAFDAPAAGEQSSMDARFPACADPRGVQLSALDLTTGKTVALRILFPQGSVGAYVAPAPTPTA